ncbi:SAM-dependent DNA methyltransferase, partial [Cyanobium sp. T1B-Tous]|uniref:BREX-1 system adenine-specific DNA-methyltransferase PglX n=1 Tax=Cyanobium sp. T1B-Tous TaxID=2823721 RepID=UPI0020CB86D6
MPALASDLRRTLENTVVKARDLAERGARDALTALAVGASEPFASMSEEERKLRNRLRARGRQLGDQRDPQKGTQSIERLVREMAYEHWHRMLFARFLAENQLLIEPSSGVSISLDECEELAAEEGTDLWGLAAQFAQDMLPEIFRTDDPVLALRLPLEIRQQLQALVAGLEAEVFTASDSLGWTYQFWQTKRKKEVNDSGVKIGADELSPVTQLFTEDYMVDFLLDNTLGAWHAGKMLAANPELASTAQTEDDLRQVVALPGCTWSYLRFVKSDEGTWAPAAGTFEGWPRTAAELTCLDPCMGSGHFVVAMFERLVALRQAEGEQLEAAAVAAVIEGNLFGLEIDPRCTQIAAFNLALAAWRRVGHCKLPAMNLACSGLAPNAREADWLAIAGDNERLRNGMERLYRLFQKASVLGSLINPRADEGDLLVAGFQELQPLLEQVVVQETQDDIAHEMAVAAHGLAKAAQILAGQFTLVSTNVPYLGRGKQVDSMLAYCENAHAEAKADLATCFIERCLKFCGSTGSTAVVSPQNWLFLTSYAKLRDAFLKRYQWDMAAKLGPRAFEAIGGEVVNVVLIGLSGCSPCAGHELTGLDAGEEKTPAKKAAFIRTQPPLRVGQSSQLGNPDARLILSPLNRASLLESVAEASHGQGSFDSPRFSVAFWEVNGIQDGWVAQQSTPALIQDYGGCYFLFRWENGEGGLAEMMNAKKEDGYSSGKWKAGVQQWGKLGVLAGQMGELPCTLYLGQSFDENASVVIPHHPSDLPALWAFCTSDEFRPALKEIDQSIKITCKTLVKVPFDLARWKKVAEERYPDGLPKPFSSDPTQWLFNGHPSSSEH